MKKKLAGLLIFVCVFFVACSGQEAVESESSLETEHELENTEMEKEENDEAHPEFASEEFVNDGAVYLYRGSDVLRFEDRVFVGEDCYEYRDGYYYYMQGQGLVELTPDGMEDAYVRQTRDYLVYWDSLTSTADRIVLVEPDTGVVVRSFDLQEFSNAGMIAFEGTYEDNIYYRTYNYETEVATVEKINCVDMSHEVIFECDEFIRNVTAREDGSLMVSALDLGWFKIDSQGQITLMLEKLDGAWDEYVTWYGESGYYTLVEYYRNHTEVLHIKEDGTRERLYGFDDFWEDIYLEDYFINIDETGMFSLYDYIIAPLDVDHNQADVWYAENIGENPPFKTLQVVETEIIEAGYRVENYYTDDDTVWLFLKKGKDLVVRSWKMGDREEWLREQQIMRGDFSTLIENELVSIADIQRIYTRENTLDNIEWGYADLNGDDAEDIIWVEKGNSHEGRKRIVAVFSGGATNECILWDVNDSGEYYFMGENGKIIHYSQYFGLYGMVRFESYNFDVSWKKEMQCALSAYEISDASEMGEWWREEHPDMMWKGRYFRYEEGNEKVQESLTVEQFSEMYREMTGQAFKMPEAFIVEEYEFYYGMF